MKAMASDIEKRYQSAEAMIADLEEFRKNPDTTLDFTIEELHEKPTNEPTQFLPAVKDVTSRLAKREEDSAVEVEYEEVRQPALPKALIIAAIIAVCAAALFGLWHLIWGSFDDVEPVKTEFEVPDLMGKTIAEAEADPEIKGTFTILQIGQRSSDTYAEGQIIEQSPAAGRTVRDNREISVFVSTGVKSGIMPNVINQEHRAARIKLRELDLGLVVENSAEEYSDTISAGYVIRSNPAEGEELREGDVVMLTISKGPETPMATVTTLTNIPLPQAQQIVSDLGLICLIDYANSDTVPIDYVISQSIPATTKVEQGSSIKLIVSLGPVIPEPVEPIVPDEPVEDAVEASDSAEAVG